MTTKEMWTMDDRTQPGRENTPNRSAPSAPGTDAQSRNGRRTSSADQPRSTADRSSSSKPALTDRERNERWPVG